MRADTRIEFLMPEYTPNEYGGREKKYNTVLTTYVLRSEVNTNKNILQYSGYRDAQITRIVVRVMPKDPWELIRIDGKLYRCVYRSERGRIHILTIMEQYADRGTSK